MANNYALAPLAYECTLPFPGIFIYIYLSVHLSIYMGGEGGHVSNATFTPFKLIWSSRGTIKLKGATVFI